MPLEAIGLTDVGRERTMNEDAFRCDPVRGLFVVSDGMGGAAAGEVASQHTVAALTDVIEANTALMAEVAAGRANTDALSEAMRIAIERACGHLFAIGQKDRSKRGMGCTCTALAVAGSRAVLAHVGDSRCYLLRRGQLTQISADHTYVAEAVRHGIIKPEDADKSPLANVITRAVGPTETVIVDLVAFDLGVDDTLLLCSDGLHQYFRDEAELAELVGGPDLEASAKKLIELSNARGGSDNISVVLARVPASAAKGASSTLADIDALRHVDLLRDLDMAEVIRLCQVFERREVANGALIIREGDVTDSFYVLVEGAVEVWRGAKVIALLPKGSHFGDMALLGQRPRTASIKAVQPCQLLVARRETLYPFLEREPMLAAKFFWKLAQTLSLRLDDLYAQSVPSQNETVGNGRETVRFGTYPTHSHIKK